MISYTAKMAVFSVNEMRKERCSPLDVVSMEGRAWPWLCDYQRHINNARYLDLMDYGRFQWFIRSGLMKPLYQNGWNGVVAATQILYRREIPMMEKFHLETRILGWDDRWYLHEQRFVTENGKVAAQALLRSSLRGKKGPVNIGEAFALAGYPDLKSPEMSPELLAFLESSSVAAKALKER